FALFDHTGDVRSGPGSPEGILHRDTRYLSHLYLTIAGGMPLLLSSILRDDSATLSCDLTNPDLRDSGGAGLPEHDLVHVPSSRTIYVEIACNRPVSAEPPLRAFFTALRDARRALRASAGRAASVASSNEIFNEALRRCVSDLCMLVTDTPEGPYPYAGIPWFS